MDSGTISNRLTKNYTSVMYPATRNLQKIEIRLRDLDGKILDVGQNNELVVVLRLYY